MAKKKKSKKKRTIYNRQEKAIMKVLYDSRRPMSIREIAEKAHMSWTTARKYIHQLEKKGWLEKE